MGTKNTAETKDVQVSFQAFSNACTYHQHEQRFVSNIVEKMLHAIQIVLHLFNYLAVVGSSVAFSPVVIHIHDPLPVFVEGVAREIVKGEHED